MAAYATKLAEAFASKALERVYESSVAEAITNQDYEGEIKDRASTLNILTFGAIAMKNYVGSALSPDAVTESNAQLVTSEQKAWYFKVGSLDKFKSYIKNPESTLLNNAAKILKQTVDAYVLGLYGDVAAGNRIGTDFTTGTCTVDVTTGVVTHSATGFVAGMVGKGFKAAGHTKWYRVSHYTSTSQIEIVDDLDDSGSGAYTGGAIAGGATFVIEAVTSVQATKDTIYTQLVAAKTKLDKAQIPMEERWFVGPADIVNLLLQSGSVTPAVDAAYQEVVKRGYVGTIAGFKIYSNEQVSGNATDGYHCLAGHKMAITYALGLTESGVEDLIGDFGKAYKGLNVYGAKVPDERRKALAEVFVKL